MSSSAPIWNAHTRDTIRNLDRLILIFHSGRRCHINIYRQSTSCQKSAAEIEWRLEGLNCKCTQSVLSLSYGESWGFPCLQKAKLPKLQSNPCLATMSNASTKPQSFPPSFKSAKNEKENNTFEQSLSFFSVPKKPTSASNLRWLLNSHGTWENQGAWSDTKIKNFGGLKS